jgi:hypothetical protein
LGGVGEEASLGGTSEEHVGELLKGDLAVTVLIESGESFSEHLFVEFLTLTDLGVDAFGDLVDLSSLEDTGVVFIELLEKFADDIFNFLGGDGHLMLK